MTFKPLNKAPLLQVYYAITYLCLCVHTHTCTHMHAHTHTHTHTHTHSTSNGSNHVSSGGTSCQNNEMRYKHSMIIMLLKGND